MVAKTNIRMEDWRAELERVLSRSGDEGMTAEEIAGALGKKLDMTRKLMRRLATAGRLGAGRRPAVRIDGAYCTVPVYWIKPKAK